VFVCVCVCLVQILFTKYLPLSVGVLWVLKLFLVLGSAILNVLGPNVVARFSLALVLLVFVPFVLTAVLATLQGQLAQPAFLAALVAVPDIKWDVFIPTVVWCYGTARCAAASCSSALTT
jgi:hypothetical protein